jgi:hypothetical protein
LPLFPRDVRAPRANRRAQMRCLVTLVDQTAELRTEYSLRREMATDSLTGLPNRAGFSDELETRSGRTIAPIMRCWSSISTGSAGSMPAWAAWPATNC